MKNLKKLLLTLLSVVCMCMAVVGLIGCKDNGENSSINSGKNNSSSGKDNAVSVCEHEWELHTVEEATCSVKGVARNICKLCGKEGMETYIDKIKHTWGMEYLHDEFSHWYKCVNCPAVDKELEHTQSDTGICPDCNAHIGSTEGVIYDISADGTYAEVIAYEGTEQVVYIAAVYEGKTVKTICDDAFSGTEITSIGIPDGVITIGEGAFSSCDSLKSVVIPDSVISIGASAFSTCLWMKEVVLGKSVTTIGSSAFLACWSLTNITIPDSVTTIGNMAFWACSNLKSVEIGKNLTDIGNKAFYACCLSNVVIPESVSHIGESSFAGCTKLNSITVDINNTAYQSIDGNLYSKDKKTLIQYALGNKADSFYVPDGVITIGVDAFSSNDYLMSVVLPDGVKNIEDDAFSSCENLTSVVIPDSVTFIDEFAFNNCDNLIFNEFGNCKYLGNERRPYHALIGVTKETYSSYTIAEGTKLIADGAFKNCARLLEIVIPNGVLIIGYKAFANCEKMTRVVFPESVAVISGSVFYNCTVLEDITFIGTGEMFMAIDIDISWIGNAPARKVSCSNGVVNLIEI